MSMPFALRPAPSWLARVRSACATGAVLAAVAIPSGSEWTPPALRAPAAPSAPVDTTAPAGRIVGIVRDARAPLALAVVSVDDARGVNSAPVTTGADGRFAFARVDTGVRVVTVRVLGCRPWYGIRRVHAAAVESLTCVPECFAPNCSPDAAPAPACIERPAEELARIGRRCRVHHDERLVADTVRIAYGLVIRSADGGRARRDFPNADWSWEGGCVLSPESKAWAIVAVCPTCRDGWARWREVHRFGTDAVRHEADAAGRR